MKSKITKLFIFLITIVHCNCSLSIYSKISQNSIIDYYDYDFDQNFEKFEPNWASLDTRKLPQWYDESKIGIFIHWGVFAVPGFTNEWFWYSWKTGNKDVVQFMKDNYPPNFTYQDFGPQFTAEFFDPLYWAKVFKQAGAKYIVLTSKHHEGFTLWPSKYSFSWNSMDIGPKRDLVGELADAVRSTTDIKFGLYHSLFEFYNPLFLSDQENNFTTNEYLEMKAKPCLYEIVNKYRPEVIWSDGDWSVTDEYWKSTEFIAWLYNDSPVKDTVVTNDRWGKGVSCKHGDFYTCQDKFNPGVLQPHKFENCFTLDKNSWGNRRDAKIDQFLTPEELIRTIVETISCGGNVLVNIGPTKDGILPPVMVERLLQMGEWLDVNGDAIYKTIPWTFQNDTRTHGVWYTYRPLENKVFAIVTRPEVFNCGILSLASVRPKIVNSIELIGSTGALEWKRNEKAGIDITLPNLYDNKSKWAWTFAIQVK